MSTPAPDPRATLAPQRVAAALRQASWRMSGGGATGSTNDDARALALAGESGGVVILADEQTLGRGRLGRAWSSPRGGVYASVLLRPRLEAAALEALPLAAGLGIAEGLERLGVRVSLKWPNDLRVDGAKLGGVLVESRVSAGQVEWVVIGFGLNVRRPATTAVGAAGENETAYAPDGADGDAVRAVPAFLEEVAGRSLDPALVAAAALDGLYRSTTALERAGFEPLAAAYRERSDIIGCEVTVRDADGRPIVSGVVDGFDASGRLLVIVDGSSIAVAAGDVTLRT